MNPMSTFNPKCPCMVHDRLNDQTIAWKPEWADDYRQYGEPYDTPDVISWDGLLLDGWSPVTLTTIPSHSDS
ncbi:hypothetical protein ACVME8_010206 [Bradyrhizobium diazoefficiens]